MLRDSLGWVLFSKNRVLQCDKILRDIYDNPIFNSITVIYKCTNELSWRGYELLKRKYTDIVFLRDRDEVKHSFINRLKHVISTFYKGKLFIGFLVDDDVFEEYECHYFDINYALRDILEGSLFFSLRLGMNITIHDPVHRAEILLPPRKSVNGCLYKWSITDSDLFFYPRCHYGYPFSVDGHIYDINLIRNILEQIEHEKVYNPNSLEIEVNHVMKLLLDGRRQINYLSPFYSVVFNVILNRVQDTCHNYDGLALDVNNLNRKYIEGYRICDYKISPKNRKTTHIVVEPSLFRVRVENA